jgi:RNA polymerase sigma factor (sigma-70 family)
MVRKKKKKNNEELVVEYQQAKTPMEKKKIADELYRKIFKLVVKYAGKSIAPYYSTQDDLIQEASLIFMKCINKFDATKKIKFSTYFGDACKYELRRYKNKQRRHVDNSYFLEIDEILTAKPENLEDKIDDERDIKKIQKALLKLHDEEKITDKQFNAIIEEHGFFGKDKKSRKEIADNRGCTLQNIGFLYRKAVNKVKEELGTDIEV